MLAGPLSAPPMPRSFASLRPMKTAPRPVEKFSPAKTGSSVWKVDDIPALPASYFLERSSAYVDGSAQDIADRICECLRKESIATSCDSDDKNLLHGETSDCLKFAVRLFTGEGKMIVEIQRKCGCSFQFREIARSLIRSAKGISQTTKRKFELPSCIPRQAPEMRQARADAGFEVALRQLSSQFVDSQLIGMESLEQMTRCESRTCISKKVLTGSCLSKVLEATQQSPSALHSTLSEDHESVIRRRAITVLANALSASAESGELQSVMDESKMLKSESLINSLIETLRDASTSPHEATQSARCIQYLMTDKQVKMIIMKMSVESIVSEACHFGESQSTLLERESKRLKLQLGSI